MLLGSPQFLTPPPKLSPLLPKFVGIRKERGGRETRKRLRRVKSMKFHHPRRQAKVKALVNNPRRLLLILPLKR